MILEWNALQGVHMDADYTIENIVAVIFNAPDNYQP